MKNIIFLIIFTFISSGISYADYSDNPKCRGYGILETNERKKCLAANQGTKEKRKLLTQDGKINIDTSSIRQKSGNFFKKLGVNTDSKLLKTGKYSEKK